jgi:hypothetical protein
MKLKLAFRTIVSLSPCSHPLFLMRGLIIGLIGLAPFARAATSDIVGFYPISLPQGNSSWVCGLVAKDDFVGTASGVTTDSQGRAVVHFAGESWEPGTFSLHTAEPQSGVCAGLGFDVLAHSTNTLTLNTTPTAGGLTTGMSFSVRKHCTLGGLLPDGGGLVPLVDSITLFSSTGSQTPHFFNSTLNRWVDGEGNDRHDTVIPPARGMVIYASQARTVMFGHGEVCYVKSTASKVAVSARVPNIVGPINPLSSSTTLAALGLTGTLQIFNDSLVILDPGALNQRGTYLYTGTSLIDGRGQNANSVVLPTGAGVVINVDTAKNINLNAVQVQP